ncbi:hypothetical protein Nhal_0946 [Nitrosococcus halophilus Nc 4]|uniref:Uncharacterized protein n=1 Tax=Nitrosococcus halophilus (strain Nc4) TaxID=472759 RepID=D5BYD6_NITHN|nr:hypothetical protein [Nitrosococcus halophilus]ADE14119.1 hypothetical protein Nhal_0946 [Nitrosococcus halophilus Nc 4]
MSNSTLLKRIEAITPDQIRGYLVSNGWIEEGSIGEIASIWHRTEAKYTNFEVVQPEAQYLKDYKKRVWDIIHILSHFEERSYDDVLKDVANFYADLVQIRVVHTDVKDGSIPIEDGVLLIKKAQALITSVTLSTLSKKKLFSGYYPQKAKDHIRNVRLGQTEAGSYIINLISPILQNKEAQSELLERVSFARAVMNTLAKSLEAISYSVEEYRRKSSLFVFDKAVEQGVSANFCDALIGLSGETKARNFSISISLSKAEKSIDKIKLEHSFSSDYIPYLEEASEYFKDNYILQDTKILGIVKKLERDENSESGLVTVTELENEKKRNITFELSGDDYLNAIHAHENRQLVECRGDLHISPRSAKLINNSGFRILSPNRDLFES